MTLLDFQPVLGRHNIRPPHFASKVSYSAAPHSLPPAIRVIRPSAFKIFAAKTIKTRKSFGYLIENP